MSRIMYKPDVVENKITKLENESIKIESYNYDKKKIYEQYLIKFRDYNMNLEDINIDQFYNHHRTDGPAIVQYNIYGDKISEKYYINGKLHRLSYPALIYCNEDGNIINVEYYIDGVLIKK